MPIYEYECDSCKEIQEISQSISDDPITTCPKCSGSVKKIISVSSFHLKGGGWYSDGYSSTKNGTAKCESSAAAPAPKKEASCPKASGASCPCA